MKLTQPNDWFNDFFSSSLSLSRLRFFFEMRTATPSRLLLESLNILAEDGTEDEEEEHAEGRESMIIINPHNPIKSRQSPESV